MDKEKSRHMQLPSKSSTRPSTDNNRWVTPFTSPVRDARSMMQSSTRKREREKSMHIYVLAVKEKKKAKRGSQREIIIPEREITDT